jgi:predicted metal-dependent enzyme (double-stranded beta helix superfamily)
VVYVVQGSEQETRYDDHGDFLVETITTRNLAGSVSALAPPGDIHRIRNDTDRIAISLHVYGIDLRVAGSSAQRFYDAPVRTAPEFAAQTPEPRVVAIGR